MCDMSNTQNNFCYILADFFEGKRNGTVVGKFYSHTEANNMLHKTIEEYCKAVPKDVTEINIRHNVNEETTEVFVCRGKSLSIKWRIQKVKIGGRED